MLDSCKRRQTSPSLPDYMHLYRDEIDDSSARKCVKVAFVLCLNQGETLEKTLGLYTAQISHRNDVVL
eukprot:c5758_g1_i1 orf=153-356(+)